MTDDQKLGIKPLPSSCSIANPLETIKSIPAGEHPSHRRLKASHFLSKRLIFLSSLLLLSFLPMASAEALKVMTFNVRYPNPDDGDNYWEVRKDLLVETIHREDPDLFGTQELFYSQGDYIASKMPQYDWFGVSRRGNLQDELMGVFYKRDRLFVIESGNFWLSATPDKPGSMSWDVSLPRMVTWARFRRASGQEFYLYNTHFPHRPQDASARFECAKVIADDIAKRVPKDAPLILIGDFNSAADSDVHKLLTKNLKDAWETAPKKSGPETTSSGWTGRREGRRIDWILYQGNWKAKQTAIIDYSRNGKYPSDHYPVTTELE